MGKTLKIMQKTAMLILFAILLSTQKVYAAEPAQVVLKVEQVWHTSSNIPIQNTTSSYTLVPFINGASAQEEGKELFITGTDYAEFAPLQFNAPGTYQYTLRQNIQESPGYIYDKQEYMVAIYVNHQAGHWTTETIVANSAGEKVAKICFTNEYYAAQYKPVIMVDPPVKKVVTGQPKQSDLFTFTLTAESPQNPMPEGSENGIKTMTIEGAGEKDFGIWAYEIEGIYRYTIAEVNTGNVSYAYDGTVYTITDTVTAADGQLTVSRTILSGTGQPAESCTFVNHYKGGSSPTTGDSTTMPAYLLALLLAAAVLSVCVTFLFYSRERKK